MGKIKAVYGIQPILKVTKEDHMVCGLNRDRHPDYGWGEFRNTNLDSDTIKEVPFDDKMKQIFIEDVCEFFSGEEAFKVLKEKGLLKL